MQLAVYLPTMVLVLMWTYRANYNVRQLGARGLRFSPAGSIGWHFVPILFLWRPYQAMKEIWQASVNPLDWHPDRPVPPFLPLWWTFWLVSLPLGLLDFRLWLRLDENSGIDFIAANIAAQVAAVWGIPLTLFLLTIMNRIHRMQREHRRILRESGSGGSNPDRQAESP